MFASSSSSFAMPETFQLHQNFRTHCGVVNLSNSIVELITYFFPETIDKMEPETSRVLGSPPLFIDSEADVVVELFRGSEAADGLTHSTCEFGAEQAILVRDTKTKQEVLKACNNNALVLTVIEAKGMEFTDCLIYNFFDGSSLENEWRLIYKCIDGSDEKYPEFDRHKHVDLCRDLKLLYVLVTRTRQRLLICNHDRKLSKPMLDLWTSRGLIEVKPLDDAVRSMFVNDSTPEQWLQKAHQFRERKLYESARFCYEKAGDDNNKQLCYAVGIIFIILKILIYIYINFILSIYVHVSIYLYNYVYTKAELEQKAKNIHASNQSEAIGFYLQAAEIYEKFPNHYIDRARCLDLGHKYETAGDLYVSYQCHEDAACCFEKAGNWLKASKSYRMYDDFENAFRCIYTGHYFDEALLLLTELKSNGTVDASIIYKRQSEYAKNGAYHYDKLGNYEEMMVFVTQFPSTQEKKDFLTKTKHFHNIVEVDIADGCYREAAIYYEKQFNLKLAADYYYPKHDLLINKGVVMSIEDKKQGAKNAIKCLFKYIKMNSIRKGYVLKCLNEEFLLIFNRIDEIVQDVNCTDLSTHTNWIKQVLLSSPDSSSIENATAVLKDIHSSTSFFDAFLIDAKVDVDMYWEWKFLAVINCINRVFAYEDWAVYDKYRLVLNELIDVVIYAIENMATMSISNLLSIDKNKCHLVMEFFGFAYDSSNMQVLTSKFPIVSNDFGPSYTKLTRKEFAQKVLNFFHELKTSSENNYVTMLVEHHAALVSFHTPENIISQLHNATLDNTNCKNIINVPSTKTRLLILKRLYEYYGKNPNKQHINRLKNELEVLRHNLLRPRCFEALIQCFCKLILCEDLLWEDVVFIRQQDTINDDILSMLCQHYGKLQNDNILNFDLIAKKLLLTRIRDQKTKYNLCYIAEGMKKSFDSQVRNLSTDSGASNRDSRGKLIMSFLIEIQHEFADKTIGFYKNTPGTSQKPLILAIKTSMEALVADTFRGGGINCIVFPKLLPQPQSKLIVLKQHGCLSPSNFIILLETYFVLLLFYGKAGNNIILSEKLVNNVLCGSNPVYVQEFSKFCISHDGSREALKLLNNLIDFILNVLEHLTYEACQDWYHTCTFLNTDTERNAMAHIFVIRFLLLINLFLMNTKDKDEYHIACQQKLRQLIINPKLPNLVIIGIPSLFVSLTNQICLTASNTNEMKSFINVYSKIGDRLMCIHTKTNNSSRNSSLNIDGLIHAKVVVHKNCISISDKSSKPAISKLRVDAPEFIPVKQQNQHHQTGVDSSDGTAVTAVTEAANENEEEEEINDEDNDEVTADVTNPKRILFLRLLFYAALKFGTRLLQARKRLSKLTIKDIKIRFLEREFLYLKINRFSEHAVKYINGVVEVLVEVCTVVESMDMIVNMPHVSILYITVF